MFETLDPLIHSRIRLAILSLLISAPEVDFNFMKESIGASDGNLSTHLSKLEQAKYISVKKGYLGKKPHTKYSITTRGREAFSNYVSTLEQYLKPGE